MFAVHWYRSNGPIREWEEACNADVMASKAAKSIPLPPIDTKLPHDDTWDRDGDTVFSQLARTPLSVGADLDSPESTSMVSLHLANESQHLIKSYISLLVFKS